MIDTTVGNGVVIDPNAGNGVVIDTTVGNGRDRSGQNRMGHTTLNIACGG